MRALWILAFATAMSAGAAQAGAVQPENMSCIIDTPQAHLQVLRNCENAYVPQQPPVEQIYLTPSDIPMIGPHDGGTKSDRDSHHDRPAGGGGNGGGANNAGGVN